MGQLAFYAFNMIGFGLPMSYVQALMDKYAQFVKMDDVQWQVRRVLYRAYPRAHDAIASPWHAPTASARALRVRVGGWCRVMTSRLCCDVMCIARHPVDIVTAVPGR